MKTGIYQKIALVVMAALALLIGILTFVNRKAPQEAQNTFIDTIKENFETKIDSQAEVTVEVVPQKLGGENENIFLVTFDTHTVNLDFDFQQIIILKDNLGNDYRAIGWTGGRGGHHLSGQISFPKVKSGVKTLTLFIFQIGGVERSFSWDLR
ncbi:hypothetical protein HY439_03210 [Candidatus Microgenomates bacterium]|nr:hypothetical protein [Candidatus Microgenomates bacterium]